MDWGLVVIIAIIILVIVDSIALFSATLKIVSAILDRNDDPSTAAYLITGAILMWAPLMGLIAILFEDEILERFANDAEDKPSDTAAKDAPTEG